MKSEKNPGGDLQLDMDNKVRVTVQGPRFSQTCSWGRGGGRVGLIKTSASTAGYLFQVEESRQGTGGGSRRIGVGTCRG